MNRCASQTIVVCFNVHPRCTEIDSAHPLSGCHIISRHSGDPVVDDRVTALSFLYTSVSFHLFVCSSVCRKFVHCLCPLSVSIIFVHCLCPLPLFITFVHCLCPLSVSIIFVRCLCPLSLSVIFVRCLCPLSFSLRKACNYISILVIHRVRTPRNKVSDSYRAYKKRRRSLRHVHCALAAR